jgi:tetratricopeptide (TPR) repeat protein
MSGSAMQKLQEAFSQFQVQNLTAAGQLCGEVLREMPNQIDALHLMGVVRLAEGNAGEAVTLLGRALDTGAGNATMFEHLGMAQSAAGNHGAAEAALRKAFALGAVHGVLYMRLAMALAAQGKLGEAATALRDATAKFPDVPDAHLNLGNFLAEHGRLDEARVCYEKVLRLQPGHAVAHFNLGNLHRMAGKYDLAVLAYQHALNADANDPDTHNNLGLAYFEQQQLDSAEPCYRRALALRPDHVHAQINLGNLLRDRDRLDEAIACYEKVLAADAGNVDALINLSNARIAQKSLADAQALCERVLRLDAKNIEARYNLGQVMALQDRQDEAIEWHRQVVEISPRFKQSYSEMAAIYSQKNQPIEAIAAARKALAIDPEYAHGHWVLSLALLLAGQYEEGWREFEWRWRWDGYTSRRRDCPQPQWRGEDIAGKTLLLHTEQGLGAIMQVARYAPLAAARGAAVVLEAPAELTRLFQTSFGTNVQVIRPDDTVPSFDLHSPLMSLPTVFGTRLDAIPWSGPYLRAPEDLIEKWRQRLRADGAGLRVGLSWAGRPTQANDRNRSMSLEHFAGLAGLPSVRFYGLQTGDAARQPIPPGLEMTQLGGEFTDFADTAALMMNLDLIVSVDTAVSHLAGALGRPAWTLLTFAADWRYLLDRTDTPWYPTMRLYRQRSRGDWTGVVEAVREDLARLSAHA